MHKIQTVDRIAAVGLDLMGREEYETASEMPNPDAILVRSTKLAGSMIPESVKSIARAGAGYNNIPLDECSARGIIVFNTPGANANSVKELVITGLLLSSRRIIEGCNWAKSLVEMGDQVPKLIEEGKKQFKGPEIKGKKLGIIGLGAIGVQVANDAVSLGMEVTGYDPFISVHSAWGLSRQVRRAMSLEALLSDSDYITLHIPLNDQTKGLLNRERFSLLQPGTKILNFSRGGLVNNADLKEAIAEGRVSRYVTDFPDQELLTMDEVIAIPHLGASTPEAEENCAVMAVRQTMDFLETGNIRNSVNYPNCEMVMTSEQRICIANRNIPNMVGQITTVLAEDRINISDMLNRHKDGYAYNIIDVEGGLSTTVEQKLKAIEGVIMVRVIAG